LKGLEVAIDSQGYIGLRCVADRTLSFILSKEAAIRLAQLISLEVGYLIGPLGEQNLGDYFALADSLNDEITDTELASEVGYEGDI
jgi:hypothetical protein